MLCYIVCCQIAAFCGYGKYHRHTRGLNFIAYETCLAADYRYFLTAYASLAVAALALYRYAGLVCFTIVINRIVIFPRKVAFFGRFLRIRLHSRNVTAIRLGSNSHSL